jgi:hypothetical protein
MLAAVPDKRLKILAKQGDKAAQEEMVKRGLASCPRMEMERRKSKHQFRVREDWNW